MSVIKTILESYVSDTVHVGGLDERLTLKDRPMASTDIFDGYATIYWHLPVKRWLGKGLYHNDAYAKSSLMIQTSDETITQLQDWYAAMQVEIMQQLGMDVKWKPLFKQQEKYTTPAMYVAVPRLKIGGEFVDQPVLKHGEMVDVKEVYLTDVHVLEVRPNLWVKKFGLSSLEGGLSLSLIELH